VGREAAIYRGDILLFSPLFFPFTLTLIGWRTDATYAQISSPDWLAVRKLLIIKRLASGVKRGREGVPRDEG